MATIRSMITDKDHDFDAWLAEQVLGAIAGN